MRVSARMLSVIILTVTVSVVVENVVINGTAAPLAGSPYTAVNLPEVDGHLLSVRLGVMRHKNQQGETDGRVRY